MNEPHSASGKSAVLWYKGRYLGGSGILTPGRVALIPLFLKTAETVYYSTTPRPSKTLYLAIGFH